MQWRSPTQVLTSNEVHNFYLLECQCPVNILVFIFKFSILNKHTVNIKQSAYVCRYKFAINSDHVPSLPHFLQVCFFFKSLARLRGTCSSRYFLASCILSTGITSGDTLQPQGEEKCARVDLLRLGLRGGLSDLQVCAVQTRKREDALLCLLSGQ